MANTPVVVNGLYADHNSLRFSIDEGSDFFSSHLVSISYGDKLTPSNSYGTHSVKMPTGPGQYSAELSVTFVKEAWDDFISRQEDGYGTLVRNSNLTYVPRNNLTSINIDFIEARVTEEKYSSSAGQGGLVVEVVFDVRQIFKNGISITSTDNDTIVLPRR